jgi:hypothetical protein
MAFSSSHLRNDLDVQQSRRWDDVGNTDKKLFMGTQSLIQPISGSAAQPIYRRVQDGKAGAAKASVRGFNAKSSTFNDPPLESFG